MAYKKDQGRMARMAVFWSLLLLLFWGSRALEVQLSSLWELMRTPLGGVVIPVMSIELSPAFLTATLVFAAGSFLIYRWLETPKIADLLIETEIELRKVTWPTGKEVFNSSVVVVVCVLVLMAFLTGTDLVLARVTKFLLFGHG
jgi:preprotein translocase subunit SecE